MNNRQPNVGMNVCPKMRVSGDQDRPTLIYLPGLHGDWTLLGGFRDRIAAEARLVEVAYPVDATWSLADYAAEIENALRNNGIREGWIIGESFGSQVAWALLERCEPAPNLAPPVFAPQGLILAGGFVRYPLMWGVRAVRAVHRATPLVWLLGGLKLYLAAVKLRHRRSPSARADFEEHLRRHASETNQQAIISRYDLILQNDPRPFAARTRLPVYYLTGFWDPIVMWFLVQPWLKKNCPGYRGWRLVWTAEHNVLGFQPEVSARQILTWIAPLSRSNYQPPISVPHQSVA